TRQSGPRSACRRRCSPAGAAGSGRLRLARRRPGLLGLVLRDRRLGRSARRRRWLGLTLAKAVLAEGLPLAEHGVNGSSPTPRQDGQGLGRAVFLLLLLLPLLGPVAAAQEQASDLAEGPAQVGVADLLAPRAQFLARRLVVARRQAGVGQELPRVVKALDLVHLVEQHQRQDRPDAGDGPQAMVCLRV